MNLIKWGGRYQENGQNGEIVYIYKNKGHAGGCGNYRPICVTQIVYKIWPGLIARKLTKITHILTSNNQYGFKEGISTTDEITKAGRYVEQADNKSKILLMDLHKAFGAIKKDTTMDNSIQERGSGRNDQSFKKGAYMGPD